MKNTLLILCFFICIFSSIQATDKEGLLWKISGNGLERPSYLFGTAHGFSDRFLETVPLFYDVFYSVQQLVVELDSFNVEQMLILSNEYNLDKFLPKEIKYSDLLDNADILFLDSLTTIYWNTTADKIPLKPNALYERLKKKYIEEERILENFSIDSIPENNPLRFINFNKESLPMDLYLLEQAKTRGYTTISLETLEDQMELKFKPNISLEQEAKSLIMKLRNQKQIINELGDGVVHAYYLQDLNKMMDSFDKATRLSGMGESYALSPIDKIKERNQNWIPIINSAIIQETSMIAVGAGHLPGEYGLIHLLRQEGYTVEEFK